MHNSTRNQTKSLNLLGYVALLLLAGILNGCYYHSYQIATPLPQDLGPLPQSENTSTIYVGVRPIMRTFFPRSRPAVTLDITLGLREAIKNGLVGKGMFKEVEFVPWSLSTENRITCLITWEPDDSWPLPEWYAALTIMSWYTLPVTRTRPARLHITYDLYIDNEMKKRYRYEFTETIFMWGILGRIQEKLEEGGSWKDDLTWEGLAGAPDGIVQKLTQTFWQEAHRDGFF